MILLALPQDDVMTHILEDALSLFVDELREVVGIEREEKRWRVTHPLAARCFTPETASSTAQRLREISKEPDYYRVNDYHLLLLYDCLEAFCEIFNDIARERPDGFYHVGPYAFREIDFESLVDHFFWDTDFLMPPEVVAGLGGKLREELGMDERIFGLSQGWEPHPEELQVERVGADDLPYFPAEPLYRPGSTRYPDPIPVE